MFNRSVFVMTCLIFHETAPNNKNKEATGAIRNQRAVLPSAVVNAAFEIRNSKSAVESEISVQ